MVSPPDTQQLLVASSLLTRENLTATAIQFAVNMSHLSANHLLPRVIQQKAERILRVYTKDSYCGGARFNNEEKIGVGVLGAPGNFYRHIQSASFELPPEWEWTFGAFSDGFVSLAGILGVQPWELVSFLWSIASVYEDQNNPLVNFLTAFQAANLLKGVWLSNEEVRAKRDDVVCQIFSPFLGTREDLCLISMDYGKYYRAAHSDTALRKAAREMAKMLNNFKEGVLE